MTAFPNNPRQPQALDAQAAQAVGQGTAIDGNVIAAPAALQPPAISNRWAKIPELLRQRSQWCYSPPGTKRPFDPKTGLPASVTAFGTWATFELACAAARFTGGQIGYVIVADDPFVFIDLDVKDDTTPEQLLRYRRIVEMFATYTELSMSGRGLHVICMGALTDGKGCRRDGVEVYSESRYMVTTGNVLDGYQLEPQLRQDLLNALAAEIRRAQGSPVDLSSVDLNVSEKRTLQDILNRCAYAQNGVKFLGLWNGKLTGYPSQSEADLALVGFFLLHGATNEQALALWETSALSPHKRPAEKRKPNPAYYINLTLRRARVLRANDLQRREAEAIKFLDANAGAIAQVHAALDAQVAEQKAKQLEREFRQQQWRVQVARFVA